MKTKILSAFSFAFVFAACASDPLTGTWKQTAASVTVSGTPVITVDATVSFASAGTFTATIVAYNPGTTTVFANATVSGTYTHDESKTPNTFTLTTKSVTAKDATGASLQTTTNAAGATCYGVQTPVCIPQTQTDDYSISGNTLTTSLQATQPSFGNLSISLTLTKQ